MLIRSQDKIMLVNLDNLEHINVSGGIINAFTNRNAFGLGIYSTKEKAIKVLDMIQNFYIACNCEYDNGNYGAVCVANDVFQMPQDDEVE